MLVLSGFALPSALLLQCVSCSFWVLEVLIFVHWQEEHTETVVLLAAVVVMDSVVSVLFARHCLVLPAFLAHHRGSSWLVWDHKATTKPGQNSNPALFRYQSIWLLHNIRLFQLSRTPNYRWNESLKIDLVLLGCFYLDSLDQPLKSAHWRLHLLSSSQPESACVPIWCSHNLPYLFICT